MIETKWGTFRKGEEVAMAMYGPCGEEYIYKGTIVGKRECMGKEYVSIESEDGYVYDVGIDEGIRILSGQAATEAIAKSYTKRHKRIKESLIHEEDKSNNMNECEDKSMYQENYYQENGYSQTPSKYNRI